MGSHSLLQGIFLTQGLNLGLCFAVDSLLSEPPQMNNWVCPSFSLHTQFLSLSSSISLPPSLPVFTCLSLLNTCFLFCFPFPPPDFCLHGQEETESAQNYRYLKYFTSLSLRLPAAPALDTHCLLARRQVRARPLRPASIFPQSTMMGRRGHRQ